LILLHLLGLHLMHRSLLLLDEGQVLIARRQEAARLGDAERRFQARQREGQVILTPDLFQEIRRLIAAGEFGMIIPELIGRDDAVLLGYARQDGRDELRRLLDLPVEVAVGVEVLLGLDWIRPEQLDISLL
jgi:hypothetical protein